MAGKLYGVGVGPGDPELITLKAKRILDEVDYIAIPKTASNKDSVALSIVQEILDKKKEVIELYFPMSYDEKVLKESWEKAAKSIIYRLDGEKNVAFITLGDPTVYSTYIYMHKLIKSKGYETEIIPGITSFCASSARAGISLGENRETIAIVPSAYECQNLDEILDSFDNVVMMKVSKNLQYIKNKLKDKELLHKAVLVSKCGFEGEEKIEFDLDETDGEKVSYFSTLIIKRNGV